MDRGIEKNLPMHPREAEIDDGGKRAVEQGFLATLKYIQQDSEHRDIRAPLKRLGEEGEGFLQTQDFERLDEKIQTNILVAHTLKKIWTPLSEWISEHPGGIGREPRAGDNLLLIDKNALRAEFHIDPDRGFRDVRDCAYQMCQHFVKQWNAQDDSKASELLKGKIANRFSDPDDPATFLLRGFTTANDITWGLLNEIRRSYKRTYGDKPITLEEYRGIAVSAKQMAVQISMMHVNTFVKVFSPFVIGDHDAFVEHPEFRGFELVEETDRPKLTLKKDTLAKMLRRSTSEQPKNPLRTGCPAMHVFDDEGHVIGKYFDWAQSVIEESYFPVVEPE